MPGAPRAASASPSDPGSPGRGAWSKRQRLRRPPEFAAFLAPRSGWRASRRWLAMSALFPPSDWLDPRGLARGAGVRFGITVSRRQGRRAVARNMVKRVLREAARHAAARLDAAAGHAPVDVLVRLKAGLPPASAAGWHQVKAQLRQEADSLFEQLHARLCAEGHSAAGRIPAAAHAEQSLAQSRPDPAAAAPGAAAADSEG